MNRARALRSDAQALCRWLGSSPRRREAVGALDQPLTARQLSRRLGLDPDLAAYCFWEFSLRGITRCLNAKALANRLHWFTPCGLACRDRLRREAGLPPRHLVLAEVDWSLYGELLYRHRAAVLLAMNGPTQPSQIRRRAIAGQSGLRMSANNTRDVVRFLVERGVATPVVVPGRAHTHYSLSPTGMIFKNLLLAATRAVR